MVRSKTDNTCCYLLFSNSKTAKWYFDIVFLSHRCQDVFLGALQLGPNIARNSALKENVFMMVVCIELRIPLFLVGKPGSSKSLAKTIVADAMQGDAAHSRLFKNLKQVRGNKMRPVLTK